MLRFIVICSLSGCGLPLGAVSETPVPLRPGHTSVALAASEWLDVAGRNASVPQFETTGRLRYSDTGDVGLSIGLRGLGLTVNSQGKILGTAWQLSPRLSVGGFPILGTLVEVDVPLHLGWQVGRDVWLLLTPQVSGIGAAGGLLGNGGAMLLGGVGLGISLPLSQSAAVRFSLLSQALLGAETQGGGCSDLAWLSAQIAFDKARCTSEGRAQQANLAHTLQIFGLAALAFDFL